MLLNRQPGVLSLALDHHLGFTDDLLQLNRDRANIDITGGTVRDHRTDRPKCGLDCVLRGTGAEKLNVQGGEPLLKVSGENVIDTIVIASRVDRVCKSG